MGLLPQRQQLVRSVFSVIWTTLSLSTFLGLFKENTNF